MTERNDAPLPQEPEGDDPEGLLHEIDEMLFADPSLFEHIGALDLVPRPRITHEDAA
ncbi:MAG TPA: hypothetical protein VL737_02435 [Candidatus Pristimantibacillus sp.]|nr:hypothetical protein [Candidatus Pristimantibacillus sp.]